jgi:hypothetical protein
MAKNKTEKKATSVREEAEKKEEKVVEKVEEKETKEVKEKTTKDKKETKKKTKKSKKVVDELDETLGISGNKKSPLNDDEIPEFLKTKNKKEKTDVPDFIKY